MVGIGLHRVYICIKWLYVWFWLYNAQNVKRMVYRFRGGEQDDNPYDSDSRIHPGDFYPELDHLDASCCGERVQLERNLGRLQERIRFQRLGGLLAGIWKIGAGTEDFWMGLERLHLLTTSGSYRLRFEWQEAVTHYWFSAEYWIFYIDDEAANYMLHVSGYVHADDGRAL